MSGKTRQKVRKHTIWGGVGTGFLIGKKKSCLSFGTFFGCGRPIGRDDSGAARGTHRHRTRGQSAKNGKKKSWKEKGTTPKGLVGKGEKGKLEKGGNRRRMFGNNRGQTSHCEGGRGKKAVRCKKC